MNINTQLDYCCIIDRYIEKISDKYPVELLEKIARLWKAQLPHTFLACKKEKLKARRENQETKDSEEKHEPSSSDEEINESIPISKNLCFGQLIKLDRKTSVWNLVLSECVFQLENSQEHIFSKAFFYIKSNV